MSRIVKARYIQLDVCNDYYLHNSREKSVTPPKASNDTVKRRAAVSTSDDEPKSLWSRLWNIIVDAWHKIIKIFIEGK